MVNDLPEPSYEQGFEDTQSIENNVDTLYTKFITPIDNLRSIAQAPPGYLQSNNKKDILANLKINATKPLESRVSAFYRMLGLPVVDKNGGYYNPGFNPNRGNEEKQEKINTNIDSKDLLLMLAREDNARSMREIFERQDFSSGLVSLLIGLYPKKFNVFENEDNTFQVNERTEEAEAIKANNSALETNIDEASSTLITTIIGSQFNRGAHVLKPFMVNPAVDFTVMPVNNKICVPFLKDQATTKLSASPDVFLLRPGIEFIIRARLKDNLPDKAFLKDLQNILAQQKKPSEIPSTSTDVLFSTVAALADENKVDNIDLQEVFGGFSSTQALVVKQLIRVIKNVIDELSTSVTELFKICRQGISFMPLPSVIGPEKIGSVLDTKIINSQIDNSILQLTIKKLNAERDVSVNQSLGSFATPFINLERTDLYDQQLQELKSKRKQLENIGLEHLRKIEIITGEVSGLGLIDILSIYTALWSIDIKALLGLLDTDAFNRLYNYNIDLRTQEVTNKDTKGISLALEELETRVINILSFADNLFKLSLSSPQFSVKGEP